QVSEYYIERSSERGILGSIFKGKVIRVLPGMQSCFVDIGLERAAFLYGGDIRSDDPEVVSEIFDEDGKPIDQDLEDLQTHSATSSRSYHRALRIQDLVKDGQEILVQVAKDAISTKGARVTTYLSLPGRYVVLMPNINHIGVSRRILEEEERNRLKGLVQKVKPEGVGIIVRTASEYISDEKIIADIEFLVKLWESIKIKSLKSKAPSLVHEDLDLVFRATRDLISRDLDRIVIDDKPRYEDLVRFLNRFSVKLGAQVQLYQGASQIFDAFGIEQEISKAIGSKVWLKSGGYLIIEQTEALAAIDVNTGRFVGGKSLGDTILKTNLEAVKEIVQQLRIRNIGGIIILDFIDMEKSEDRDRVFQALSEELKKDKAKTTVLRISEMGLVQMTRKRTEESLLQKLSEGCPYCEGKGHIKSTISVTYDVLRELKREIIRSSHINLIIKVNPHIADRLLEDDKVYLDEIRLHSGKKIFVKSVPDFHIENFEITSMRTD
ncbi:MAG: Rne/Rng family ribonuclease, partial [Silvanigrellaceae bacterium]|nr:Rne/Rng family ribonuclease [Silvanigrellaceae bacterium]